MIISFLTKSRRGVRSYHKTLGKNGGRANLQNTSMFDYCNDQFGISVLHQRFFKSN